MQSQWIIPLIILKTAGTTLLKILERQYKSNSILLLDQSHPRETVHKLTSKMQSEQIKYVKGPVYFGVHEFLPQSCTYITMLREPVDRIVSYYYHLRRDINSELHAVTRQMSLKDFVSSDLTLELENGQTRALSGIKQDSKDNLGGCSSNEILALAKKNLKEHYSVVGLTERFDESLILLKRAFGWKRIYYVKRNVGANRVRNQDIPKEILDIIKKKNELDIELYKYAQERLNELIREQGPSFDRELRRFQSLNKLYGKYYGTFYIKLYDCIRPMTTRFRRWLKSGHAVCLTIVSTSLFESVLYALDDIF